MQLGKLHEIEPRLVELGYRLIAISTDRPEKLRESIQKHDLSYTLLSDSTARAARAFRIAYRVEDATYERLQGFGIDLEEASGEAHHLLPVPSVFLVGRDGIIRFVYSNPDYTVRIAPEALLEAARVAAEDAE